MLFTSYLVRHLDEMYLIAPFSVDPIVEVSAELSYLPVLVYLWLKIDWNNLITKKKSNLNSERKLSSKAEERTSNFLKIDWNNSGNFFSIYSFNLPPFFPPFRFAINGFGDIFGYFFWNSTTWFLVSSLLWLLTVTTV